MNIDKAAQIVGRKTSICTALGIRFLSTPDADTVQATMPVDERTRQPFGYLSGGAMLAMHECTAGVGSLVLCPDVVNLGINVSANHVHAAPEGTTVTATARLVSQTRHLHVWLVTITDEEGQVVSTAHVTNYISSKPTA